jgi:DNA-binding CsgD family transcriptional regulator/PAS domain-containing protein
MSYKLSPHTFRAGGFAVAGTGLERTDLEGLLAAIAKLAAVRPLADLRTDTVSVLPSLVETHHPAWNDVDPETGRIEAVLPADFEREYAGRMPELAAEFAAHVDEHPVIVEYRRTGNGRPQAISDFVSEEAFHATALYRKFYVEIGTEDQLSFVLPAPDVLVGITLDRPERGFNRRDRTILNLLRPHLVQAYRNAVALEAATAALEAVDTIGEARGDGVIVLDRTGRIVHSTPTAISLLDRSFPDRPAVGLPEPLADYVARPGSQDAPAWPMVRDDLVVRCLSSAGTTVLVLGCAGGTHDPKELCHLGLTPREAEVLTHVSAGASTKDIAARLQISPRTVDKHVERSLSKLGVDSRLAAANLINQIAL